MLKVTCKYYEMCIRKKKAETNKDSVFDDHVVRVAAHT